MTKTKLTNAITNCVSKGEKAFVPYIMAGDGGLEKLKKDILFLQETGVTAIELGIPFSDPVADGPVIQAAGERALSEGVTLKKVLETIREAKEEITVPIVLMTYLNPILAYGIERFVEDAVAAEVSGIIVPDLPLEESALLKPALEKGEIALVPLVSLTSPKERIEKIVSAGEGFIYAVTVNGITGVRSSFESKLDLHLQQLKEVSAVPVLAGFGISTAEQVRSIGTSVDGVIVGSAIVQALHEGAYETVKALVHAAKEPLVAN